MLNEMEVTGQAFEDMQEQNSRLIQQLREKDDANFKLMTERIKSNQLHKLAREEKDVLKDQVISYGIKEPIYLAFHYVLNTPKSQSHRLTCFLRSPPWADLIGSYILSNKCQEPN